MKQFSKHIALFLALVVLSNGLFAAQMTASMIESSAQEQTEIQKPCHGDSVESENLVANEAMDCCEGDCSSCVLTSSVSAITALNIKDEPQSPLTIQMTSNLLAAHTANLYRPPITI